MPRFKLKLTCPVEVTAHTTIEVEAENIDEAYAGLEDTLDDLSKKDGEALRDHYKNPGSPYPKALVVWTVDQDDVDNEISNKLADIEEYEEIEE